MAPQYELYNRVTDPEELYNLLPVGGVAMEEHKKIQLELHEMLTNKMKETDHKRLPDLDDSTKVTPRHWERTDPEYAPLDTDSPRSVRREHNRAPWSQVQANYS
ncbi:MAG: hypothetical protein OEU26_14595 [Candidatus Tectomicrobia bacterium]|nr:hypothetical protein [Candidatus Tectomicrobia bacterium]